MNMKCLKNLYWLLMFSAAGFSPAFADEASETHSHIKLVSEQTAVALGSTFWAGFDLGLDDGWHAYWQNPGDAGLSPKIKWKLPAGISAGDIHWPYPKLLPTGPLVSYGYDHEVFLLVPVSVDSDFQNPKEVALEAHADWLACKDICVPYRADLKLTLPVAKDASAIKFNDFKHAFDQSLENIPIGIPMISSSFVSDGDYWDLRIQTPHVKSKSQIIFYPFRDDLIEHAAAEELHVRPQGYEVKLKKSHLYQGGDLKALQGVAVNPDGWLENDETKAIIINAHPAPMPIPMASASTVPVKPLHFWLACLFALIGGLILNLMPCVLPMISIKVLHLLERHPDRRTAFCHSLAYAAGILISVWALGLLLAVLKSAGKFAGWGFQFQSPVFVIVVAMVLFALALNLFGVFEFSTPDVGSVPLPQTDYLSSFVSGIITTIVASPCTAPFMGTALTLAISQTNLVGFAIFTFLGLGLALPIVLLSAFPGLLAVLPKPGIWMLYLKRVLGIILLACVLWLLWVFSIETGMMDLFKLSGNSSQGIQWQAYSSPAVEEARRSGHGVFLDFTAAWCINCQVNDRLVLQNPGVVHAFKDQSIIAFKGDWTKYDPGITKALASFGRDSIPVYVYYAPSSGSAEILPQLITPKMILEKITKH